MPRWQPYDVVGGAYSDDTRPWSVQDTVNYLVVNAERPGGRSTRMLREAPGMVTFCASMPESSVRGLYVAEGRLFAVVGTSLYSIGTDGLAASLGTIPGVGRCVFTHNQITNGNEVVIGNGQSGYVYDTTDGTLTQITDEGFPGFRSVDFADQYVIGVEPFGRYWFHSDLADATSYNTLDRAEAEKAPDRIQQAIATGSDVLVLGERTGQFFYNTGEATGTWSNRSGAEMDVGAASPWTACRLDNTVYWLGNDGSVYRLNGYTPQRISTHALEQAISRCNLADAYAFTFEDRGHKCYLLTFPDGRTWCFDAATQEWTRRESYGFDRWRVSALAKWGRHWIAGDFINGKLYQLDWNVKQEAGEPLERRRVTGVLHDDQNRLIVNAFELVFDTGMDEDSPPLPEIIIAPLSLSGDHPGGEVGIDPGSTQYVATGGVLPRSTYTITSGSLPPGRTLNASTGEVTGTPTVGGTYTWTVSITDADGAVATLADSAAIATHAVLVSPNTAAGTDYVLRSTDATTYATSLSSGLGASVARMFAVNGRVFALSANTTAGRVSADRGDTWTSITGMGALGKGGMTYAEHAGVGRYLVFMASGSSAYSSVDGVAFTAITVPARTYYSAAAMGSTVVVMSSLASLIRSTDGGQTFSAAFSNGVGTVEQCLATETYFFAAGTNGLVLRSATGETWTSVLAAGNWQGLAYGQGRLMVLGSAGECRYSDDNGGTWTVGPTIASFNTGGGSTQNLTYAQGVFIAVGNNQQVYTTPATGTPVWTQRKYVANPPTFEDVVAVRYVP